MVSLDMFKLLENGEMHIIISELLVSHEDKKANHCSL
jgi:hypothetical protein